MPSMHITGKMSDSQLDRGTRLPIWAGSLLLGPGRNPEAISCVLCVAWSDDLNGRSRTEA